ncbi:hypothetical protein [Legionella hackeliae]|uniref:LphB n=1 Tax=Legionella hackeliae TaxID=449 RepID=A0A0A8UVM8_LEGHA|nr:hypothetical protein [Legionella hackeliae]KTD09571.1 LphB [Legionella hackeliae]CEK11112.1 conserved membrane protein of unknown function [Legionella hackeliae]STX47864.1 LphB [Legionella hackeliae]
MIKKNLIVAILLCFVFGYLLILQVQAIWPFTIDDMYISLRYAKHWVAGHGVLWNIGEEPVEGYSNFSFVALAALAIKLGFNPITLLKSLGVMGLVLSAISLYYLSRFWFSAWIAFIPCIWLLLYKGEILWSVSGLETTFYQGVICLALVFLFRGMGYQFFSKQREEANTLYWILAAFLLAIAALTRPDAPAFILIFYGLALFDRPKNQVRDYYKGLFLSSAILALLFMPYFFWRWHYYGRLFPNAVYCKGFISSSLTLDLIYLELIWPFVVLALPAIVKAKDKRHYFLWLPSLVYLGLLVGADPIVAFANRLFLAAFILLLPLTLQGMSDVISYCMPENERMRSIALTIVALLFAFFFIPKMTLTNYRYFAINPQEGIQLRQQVVEWLNSNVLPNSRVVLADSGQVPYASSLNFIDSYCLNNKKMTEPSTQNMFSWLCDEIFKTKPEVIILTSLKVGDKVIYTPVDFCLKMALKNNHMYKFGAYFKTNNQNSSYRYEIYTLLN